MTRVLAGLVPNIHGPCLQWVVRASSEMSVDQWIMLRGATVEKSGRNDQRFLWGPIAKYNVKTTYPITTIALYAEIEEEKMSGKEVAPIGGEHRVNGNNHHHHHHRYQGKCEKKKATVEQRATMVSSARAWACVYVYLRAVPVDGTHLGPLVFPSALGCIPQWQQPKQQSWPLALDYGPECAANQTLDEQLPDVGTKASA